MAFKPRGPASRRAWRPEIAYVVGLLATDGNLSSNGRSIFLVSRDIELLSTVARILDLRNRIADHPGGYSRTGVYHLAFGDRLFHDWLMDIGIQPRKTHTIGALKVPDEFFCDFLRGHLDGDGSITSYVDRYNTKLNPKYVYQRLYVRFLSASEPHIRWLQQKVDCLLGVDGYVTVAKPRPQGKLPLYTLHFAKKDAITLLRWIYYAPDVPCLARKRAIAEPFLVGDIRQFRHPPGVKVREVRARYRPETPRPVPSGGLRRDGTPRRSVRSGRRRWHPDFTAPCLDLYRGYAGSVRVGRSGSRPRDAIVDSEVPRHDQAYRGTGRLRAGKAAQADGLQGKPRDSGRDVAICSGDGGP